jgi:galactokinase
LSSAELALPVGSWFLLGYHSDYNLGFILSAAIYLGSTIESSPLSKTFWRLVRTPTG